MPLPVPRVATVIEDEPVNVIAPNIIRFKAKLAVDSDGKTGSKAQDPDWQGATSLEQGGQPLDALKVRYIALSPRVIRAVPATVLGCLVELINLTTGRRCLAVVGDVGPPDKLGEASRATAAALGLNDDPRHGGTDLHEIEYTIFAGVPAVLDGVTYTLKKLAA